MPVISIVGRSDSGKTTLIERLVPVLAGRDYRVATVKHHHGDYFEADTRGKDSWRHGQAGAVATALCARHQLAIFLKTEARVPLEDVVRQLVSARFDLVLTEGFKDGPFPKIEVVRAALCQPPLCRREDGLIALVTDADWKLGVARFGLDDVGPIADFIARFLSPVC
ncbi:MAG: molybdopterin-guanine dinucleotide biosynthesis protein B [bacterium]